MEHFYQNIQGWFDYEGLYRKIISNLTNNSHIVEIGCWKGKSTSFLAVEIINSGKNIKLDCIDTWQGSTEHNLTTQHQFDELYNTFLSNTEAVRNVINPIRTTSIDASKLYQDHSLDFVFIDAAHDYENVKLDIQNWLPKVKVGRTIAGHDYAHYCEDVQRAVRDSFPTSKILTDGIASWLYVKE